MITVFQKIINLTKQLYPTGRVWRIPKLSILYRLHEGLALSEERVYNELKGLLDSALPDNDNFSVTDAQRHERALGLVSNETLTLAVRKEAIKRKINFPGTIKARQHYLYMQGQLQAAGFDVYVHENRFLVSPGVYEVNRAVPSIYGRLVSGTGVYGNKGISNYSVIANETDEAKDSSFNFGDDLNLRYTFFIGSVTFPNRTNVDITRKKEFRDLILKLKPAQTAGFLLIDYI